MKNKLLFITSANLATNPRLVKEIDSFSASYEIDVVLFNFIHWSSQQDEILIKDRSHINFIKLDVSKTNYFNWLIWALLEKFGRSIFPLFSNSLFIASLALSRKSIKLLISIKKNKDYSLIIAHNIPTLYPAYYLSKKWNIPFSYDIEDYDPGMKFKDSGSHFEEITTLLCKRLLPKAKLLTSASSLIGTTTLNLIKGHPNHKTIINSFPNNEFSQTNTRNIRDERLKFVWFSLTITKDRGLEEFFEAIEDLDLPIDIKLIGALSDDFNEEIVIPFKLKNSAITLNVSPPISQIELHKELSGYDIGLALELPSNELNRDICLSNKIIAYAQSGLYILASNTQGQQQFMNQDSSRGIICELTKESISKSVETIYKNRSSILEHRMERFVSNASLCWENQFTSLSKLVEQSIS